MSSKTPKNVTPAKQDNADSIVVSTPAKAHQKAAPYALQVLDSPQMSTSGGHLDGLGQRAREELAEIDRMQSETSLRAIVFGLIMWQVKHSLPHGKFRDWQTKELTGLGKTQCNNYMRLALAYVEETKVQVPEILTLSQLTLDLTPDAKEQIDALERARAFVQSKPLNDLLIEHGIKPAPAVKKKTAPQLPKETPAAPDALTEEGRAAIIEGFFEDAGRAIETIRHIMQEATPVFQVDDWKALHASIHGLAKDLEQALPKA